MIDHDNSVDSICAHPTNENEFTSGSHDTSIKIWDASTFKTKTNIKAHEKGVWSVTYDKSGDRLISCSPDSTAKVWDVKSGKCA